MNDVREPKPKNERTGSRRRRRRSRRRSQPSAAPEAIRGYLWVRDQGQAVLVDPANNFVAGRNAPLVPHELIRPLHLDSGLLIDAMAVPGDRPRVVELTAIEEMPPDVYRAKALPFTELISIDPNERFRLETEPGIVEPRVSELIAPLGKGQRCLIVSPPKAGKTTLLQQMAQAIGEQSPQHHHLRPAGRRAARGGDRLEAVDQAR